MPGTIVQDLHTVSPNSCPDFAKDFFTTSNTSDNSIPCLNFSSCPVTQEEILNTTKDLLPKTSLDHDGVSMSFLKNFIHILAGPLRHFIQLSLDQGIVPVQLKIAKVIPIFKSGDKSKMDNYRPISLLSNFSTILEKVVASRLINFLETNNLLSPSQFGFRKNHSTLHPLIHFMNFVTSAQNNKEHALAIFCDLCKAFDTVDHGLLLKKLSKVGVHGTELKWFENYLSERKQFVQVNGSPCNLLNILLGVPQGSILGPLLFLIYINDLPLCSKLCSYLFADDTTILASKPSTDALFTFVNEEFHKIVYYFRAHRLVFHPEKTVFMLFSHANIKDINMNIYIDSNNYNETDSLNLKNQYCVLIISLIPKSNSLVLSWILT
jgi:hypothetical protein